MNIHIDTTLEWNGKDVIVRANRVVEKSPFEAGLIIQALAASLCLVDEGRLRNSITVRDKRNTKSIGSIVSGDLIGQPKEKNGFP